MKTIRLIATGVLLLAAGLLANQAYAAGDTCIYKGDANYPGYKVVVSSWQCFYPWGIWSSTLPVISDEVLLSAGYPVFNNDWIADNQGDGTNGYDCWTGTAAANCVTTGNKETFRVQHGKNLSIGGRSTGLLWLRTLQNTTNTTTMYFFMTGENK